ncbi:DgyrCDS8368 [Dimorphilus gyrociliatus]|uniref:DgyrCDS8368 n=1 Tax=Dimorphilus gyrociliatus TaxID=2664684 RepID=A0A7I8VW50_9ANNE|nr:DgyrCDS8368 [Dimorphilus gyrociliatus]
MDFFKNQIQIVLVEIRMSGRLNTMSRLIRSIPKAFDKEVEGTKDCSGVDRYRKTVSIKEKQMVLSISVIDPSDRLSLIMECKTADGVLMVFEMNEFSTFKIKLQQWPVIKEMTTRTNCQLMLIGNFPRSDEIVIKEQEDARQLANEWNIPFFSISCETGENVNEALNHLTKEIIEKVTKSY